MPRGPGVAAFRLPALLDASIPMFVRVATSGIGDIDGMGNRRGVLPGIAARLPARQARPLMAGRDDLAAGAVDAKLPGARRIAPAGLRRADRAVGEAQNEGGRVFQSRW